MFCILQGIVPHLGYQVYGHSFSVIYPFTIHWNYSNVHSFILLAC